MAMIKAWFRVLAAAATMGWGAEALAVPLTITTFDAPWGSATRPTGINDLSQIVGDLPGGDTDFGFLRTGNTYAQIRASMFGVRRTQAEGINSSGVIVGSLGYDFGVSNGFILSGGTFTEFAGPGANVTAAFGVNDADLVVGTFGSNNTFEFSGFIYDGSVLTPLDLGTGTRTLAQDINNGGDVVGSFQDESGTHGFVRDGAGTITVFDVPGASITEILGINDLGYFVGRYTGLAGPHGFFYDGTEITTIEIPDGTSIVATDINNLGQIIGSFRGIDGVERGFLATIDGDTTVPVGEPEPLALLIVGMLGLVVPSARRALGR